VEPPNELYQTKAMPLAMLIIKTRQLNKNEFDTFHISDEARSDLTLLIFKHNRSPEEKSWHKG
jgi:hypothetical protein